MAKKNPNLKRELKTLKGETYPMSFPSKGDIEKVRGKKEVKEVLTTDLPNETVQNVIINSLSNYEPLDRKEVFMINQVAEWAMNEPKGKEGYGELKNKLFDFITLQVLPYATVSRTEKKEDKTEEKATGVYSAWVIAQVYEELGVTE